jgi:phosphate/sulfate permease
MALVFSLIPVILLVGFYSYASPGTINEPAVTYNLYVAPVVTALTSALILFFVGRKFKTRDRKDEQIATLLAEKEQKKEEHIKERWNSFTATQCAIKSKLDEVSKDLTNKVDWTFCHDKEEEISRKIDRLDDRIRT